MTADATGTRPDLPIAAWLGLAAAPTFAVMGLATAVTGAPDMLCAGHASGLSGMVPMYLLMSLFHLAPWLKLIAGRPKRTAERIARLRGLDLAVARRRVGDERVDQLARGLGDVLDRAVEGRLVRLRRRVKPLSLRTNCSDAARISASVAGGSKLKSVLMFGT